MGNHITRSEILRLAVDPAEPAAETQKEEGFLSDVFGSRKERTLTGCLIGSVRDVFSGNLSDEEKSKRAQSHDFVATIAADTVSMLGRRAPVAGIVRATMLMDTKSTLRDTGLNFLKDGLEGAALNKIAKISMPRATSGVVPNFVSGGLKVEAKMHAISGGLFGLEKAVADPLAWRDEHGKFSVRNGLSNLTDGEKLLKATAFGAVVNVPAGIFGTRIAQATTTKTAQRTGFEQLGVISGGTLSGAGSGGVFGGLDAVVHGRDVLQGTWEGALVGAGTGGVMAGYHAFRGGEQSTLARFNQRGRQVVQERLSSSVGKETYAIEPIAVREATRRKIEIEAWHSDSARMQKIFEAVDFIPFQKEGVVKLGSRLKQDRVETMDFRRLVSREGERPKHKKWDDFVKNETEAFKQDVVVYKVDGMDVEIAVPQDYAQRLERVRSLRQLAEKEIPAWDNLPAEKRLELQSQLDNQDARPLAAVLGHESGRTLPVVLARLELGRNKFNQRALPEDFIPLLSELPNRSLVKKLILLDERYYGDAGPNKMKDHGPAAATADSDGVITFYEAVNSDLHKTALSGKLREYMQHEWAHLVLHKLKAHGKLFNHAADLERKDNWYARTYAKKQYPDQPELKDHENFAVHLGENLIAPDGDSFLMTAQKAPIRTAVMARMWLESMIPQTKETIAHPSDYMARINRIPETVAYREAYAARLRYIGDEIMPLAREKLVVIMKHGKSSEQAKAAELLGYLGNKEDMAFLYGLVKTSQDQTVKQTAYDAAVRLVSSDHDQQLDFMVATAKPDSPVRKQALTALGNVRDYRARQYLRFLSLAGDSNNIKEIVDLIPHMPDEKGMVAAFNEAIRLASAEPYGKDFSVSLAKLVAENHPQLRQQALEVFSKHLDSSMAPALRRLTHVKDKDIAGRASALLAEVKIREKLAQYRQWLGLNEPNNAAGIMRRSTQDPEHVNAAIDGLAYLGDHRAIEPLLEVVAGPHPKWGREALYALKHYPPNVVSSYVHDLQRSGRFPMSWLDLRKQLFAGQEDAVVRFR
ncbi:MAG TPA: hypothetical protein V6D17_19160 [Candidatus Obscuribacterales bacterium]